MDQRSTHQAESQTDSAAPKSHGLRFWPVWILAVPVLYVLSIGPAFRLWQSRLIPERPMTAFYAPLGKLLMASPVTARCYAWYLNLWSAPEPEIIQ